MFRDVREMFEVFRSLRTCSDLFGPVWMRSDAFGCVWMRSDAFGGIRTLLEIFGNFGQKYWFFTFLERDFDRLDLCQAFANPTDTISADLHQFLAVGLLGGGRVDGHPSDKY